MSMLRLGTILLLAVLSLGELLAAEDFAIRLVPAEKVGLKYQVTGRLNEFGRQTLVMEGNPTRQEAVTNIWNFEGKVEVLEVDSERQVATKMTIAVKKMTLSQNGTSKEVLPEGSVITGSLKDGKKAFEVNGQALEASASRALKEFIYMYDKNESTDDVIYGTKDRKKVGDAWPINVEAARKALTDKDVNVTDDDLSGQTKVEAIEEVDGQKCIKVTGTMMLKKLMPKLPPGLVFQKGEGQTKVTTHYSLKDNRRVQAVLDYKMQIKANGTSPNGVVMEMTVENSLSGEKKFKYE